MLKLVEELSGTGDVRWQDRVWPRVPYALARYQGMAASGLPIPGWHRTEGSLDVNALSDVGEMLGASLTLRLEDGRALAICLADTSGRVLSEGHGPSKCLCC
jgi:hypothetical protein